MKSPVLRNIVAAVVGYLVMFAVAFVLFSLMWRVLGADGSFEPGSWNVSGAWIGSSLALGAIVSLAGGFVCSRLAASYQGVAILIGLVLVLGALAAMPDAGEAAAGASVRPDDVSMFAAMSSALQPTWLRWLNPVIGAVAVALGARLEGGKTA